MKEEENLYTCKPYLLGFRTKHTVSLSDFRTHLVNLNGMKVNVVSIMHQFYKLYFLCRKSKMVNKGEMLLQALLNNINE